MKRTHRRRKWVQTRFHLGLVALLVTSVLTALGLTLTGARLAGWRATTVVSGSMAPAIDAGDVVLAARAAPGDLEPGRVVVFRDPAGAGLVTHRLESRNGDGTWTTKGDANRRADSTPLVPSAIVGVGRAVVPAVGQPVAWRRTGRAVWAAAALLLFALFAWASRFALLERFDPWRRIPTSYLVDGRWVLPVIEPAPTLLPRLRRRRAP